MRIFAIIAGVVVLATGSAAVAQDRYDPYAPRRELPYDRGYDADTPRTRAINEAERPMVEAANADALAQAEQQTANGAIDTDRYAQDMADYDDAMRQRDDRIADDRALYDREELAYQDALADWRVQVADCRSGVRAACNAPTPDPADY